VRLLQPFLVASWHGAGLSEMPGDVKEIYTNSDVPNDSNVFAFVLDSRARLVHSFKGNVNRRAGDVSWEDELTKAIDKMNLATDAARAELRSPRLPDLDAPGGGTPAGVRVFVRRGQPAGGRGGTPVVELVPMTVRNWAAVSLPENAAGGDVAAGELRAWFEQLYPPAIRTADQRKPFQTATGTLRLEPAGADDRHRFALLRGEFRLSKGPGESEVEGEVAAVLTYRLDTREVQSVHGVVDAAYIYRVRGNERISLTAAIESRPE
jgi:hypothetical protein